MNDCQTDYYDHLAALITAPTPPQPSDNETESQKRQRLGTLIYRNNHRFAYSTVLRETFPIVEQLVGQQFFSAMAQEYLHAHPPQARIIRFYGEHFADFIDSFPPAHSLPFLANVARLEYARLKIFHQPSPPPLDPLIFADQCNLAPERLRFTFTPALCFFNSDDGAISVWRHERRKQNAEPVGKLTLRPQQEYVAFSRPGAALVETALDQTQFHILTHLQQGAPLTTALEPASPTWLADQQNLNQLFALIMGQNWVIKISQ